MLPDKDNNKSTSICNIKEIFLQTKKTDFLFFLALYTSFFLAISIVINKDFYNIYVLFHYRVMNKKTFSPFMYPTSVIETPQKSNNIQRLFFCQNSISSRIKKSVLVEYLYSYNTNTTWGNMRTFFYFTKKPHDRI